MSKPSTADWEALKRLGRYLVDKTRVAIGFPYQEQPETREEYVDTDHAGCLETRKSTSGGIAMHGSHNIKAWSSTQQVIALSSGEAEYYGMVKGAGNALGISGVFSGYGNQVRRSRVYRLVGSQGNIQPKRLGQSPAH